MLSQIVLSSKPKSRLPSKTHLSISQLFPCPYALYRTLNPEGLPEPITTEQDLLMDDGKWQEEQTVQRLKLAGVLIECRQLEVSVGRSKLLGHIDGTFTLGGLVRLFEHKAMNFERFSHFKEKGLEAFPGIRSQVQVYMLGARQDGFDIEECSVYCKHKDTCEPYDILEPFDEGFATGLVDWVDKVVLDGWVPEPRQCDLCSRCNFDCFGAVLDLSNVSIASAPEAVEKWRKGRQFQDVGKMLEEEARAFLIGIRGKDGNLITHGLIGDGDILKVEDIEVRKIIQHRFDISRQKVLEEFGPEGLIKVGEEKEVIQYRIREV